MDMEDGFIAVPVGECAEDFHGVIKLNSTATIILDLLKEDVDEKEIVDTLEKEYEAPRDQLISDVHQFLDIFRERGLLTE